PFSSVRVRWSVARTGRAHVLPSFPTRRSSDLADRAWVATCSRGCSVPSPDAGCGRSSPSVRRPRPRRTSRPSRACCRRTSCVRRSEEHTSELQSRENLVCRLLLEKKKKEAPRKTPSFVPLIRTDPFRPLPLGTHTVHVLCLSRHVPCHEHHQ